MHSHEAVLFSYLFLGSKASLVSRSLMFPDRYNYHNFNCHSKLRLFSFLNSGQCFSGPHLPTLAGYHAMMSDPSGTGAHGRGREEKEQTRASCQLAELSLGLNSHFSVTGLGVGGHLWHLQSQPSAPLGRLSPGVLLKRGGPSLFWLVSSVFEGQRLFQASFLLYFVSV